MISPPASREILDQARGSCLGQRTGMPVWEPVAQPVLKQAIFCQLQRVKTGSWGLYRPCGLDHGSCRIICDPSARRSPGSLLNAPPPVLPWSHQPAAVQIDKRVITPRIYILCHATASVQSICCASAPHDHMGASHEHITLARRIGLDTPGQPARPPARTMQRMFLTAPQDHRRRECRPQSPQTSGDASPGRPPLGRPVHLPPSMPAAPSRRVSALEHDIRTTPWS